VADDLGNQSILDTEHLKLLSIFYMVSAGLSAFYSLIGLIYTAFGVFVFEMISKMPTRDANDVPPPAFIGWIISGFGFLFFLAFAAVAALKLRTAFCIKGRKSRILCLVIAVISCLEIPYGTLLGVFTFIVLDRASVRSEFDRPRT
jgi:hypothetical protein